MQSLTRRDFAKYAAAPFVTTAFSGSFGQLFAAETSSASRLPRPNSKVAGVQIGINAPYSFGNPLLTGDEILQHCLTLGLSAVELRTQPVEAFLGVPAALITPKNNVAPGTAAANAEELRRWRQSVSLQPVKAFRRKYESAGVRIEIVKVDGIFKMSDAEIDYAFRLAKALGGRAISTEISHDEADLKRVGGFADRHRLRVGYHGHATTTPAHWEAAFRLARYNGANVDLGHFVAGNSTSVVDFIRTYHSLITHVHVKDRQRNNGPNRPFGEGDTPIVEVLRLIRDRRWKIQATLEFEYAIPSGSDRMTELARCVRYCRTALA